jgi:hypothetical protein
LAKKDTFIYGTTMVEIEYAHNNWPRTVWVSYLSKWTHSIRAKSKPDLSICLAIHNGPNQTRSARASPAFSAGHRSAQPAHLARVPLPFSPNYVFLIGLRLRSSAPPLSPLSNPLARLSVSSPSSPTSPSRAAP